MKAKDFLSERMVFGLLIVCGYLGCMVVLAMGGLTKDGLPPAVQNLIAQGMGTLGTAVGVIVAAIWKNDRTDRQNADTMASLAATAASAPPATPAPATAARPAAPPPAPPAAPVPAAGPLG